MASTFPLPRRVIGGPGFVYLLQAVDGPCKIGRSRKPVTRCHQLDTSWLPVFLLHAIPTERMGSLEYALHSRYRERHLRHEWFDLLPEQVEEFLSWDACPLGSFIDQQGHSLPRP
jgi:hypothetical protein